MIEETLNSAESINNQETPFQQLMAQNNFLDPARIEQPLAPQLKWSDNFVNQTNFIKDNTAGVTPHYTPSNVKDSQINGQTVGSFEAVMNGSLAKVNNMTDQGAYVQPYAYDASPQGTFRDRYKAYGQETYNKIGFHPLIDNETWFNQNTTFGDDIKRWATNSAWPMLSKGFMDPIKSYQSILNGDGLFYADEQSARDYEYYNAIGASTKGGLGGFTVNLLNSASYSLGILTEGAVEGALIGGLFGGGNVATGALEGAGSFVNKLGSLPRALVDAGKATGKLMSGVKTYSNLSKAKELFGSASRHFGNFINPLHNTTAAFQQLKNTDNITNLARSSVTAGALWHDMMAMNLALSEGKLEGGFTRYQAYDRLYNDYVAENGKPPSLEQQESMMKQASKGAFWNTLSNTALIYYSNKIAFPSITNASFLKGVPKFAFGKTVANVGKEFQIIFDPGKKALEGAFTKQRVNLVNAIKSLAKPQTYGKVGLNYFKANVVEGGQEVMQDVLQDTFQNYYVNTYKNKDARNFRYGLGLMGDAIEKQWSAQGLETFLSGFLMGTILQTPGFIKKYATVGYNDYLKKDSNYKEYLDGREELADTVVDQLNTMYKNGHFFFDPRINNYANQALVANVVDNPEEHTTKEIKDAEFAAFQSAVLGSLQNGTFDMFIKHYEGYKQASAEDIEQAWSLKPGQGTKALERFDKALENAKQIKDRWNTAKEKMKFQVDATQYAEGTEERAIAEIYNKAYNQSLYNYVFLHNSFDDNAKRLTKLYEGLSSISVFKNSNFANFVNLVDPTRLTREIEMLKTEVESLESFGTAESLDEASKKREKIELYSKFNEKQEKLVELFIDKTLGENNLITGRLNEIKKRILESNTNLDDDQAASQAIEELVDQYESGESNEFLEYKEAFTELLYGLADTAEERMQLDQEIQSKGGIDDLFTDLLDTHILKNENAKLIDYVNMLATPREFYEHLMRNFKFMKDLYNNKEEIAKEIVNQEIAAIENNTLLNTLADQGIYVDLDEFAEWVETRKLPEQFFDVTNKRIINKGSVLYEDFIDIFYKAAELASKKPAGEPLTQKQLLDKRIEELESERAGLLDKEKEKFDAKFLEVYGMSLEEYKIQEAQRVAEETISDEERKQLEELKTLFESAAEKLQSNNYLEVQAAAEVVAEKAFTDEDSSNAEDFFNEQVAIYQNDPEKKALIVELIKKFDSEDPVENVDAALKSQIYGEAVALSLNLINEALAKEPAAPKIDVENTKEYLAYQEAVDAINEKYDNLISDVKEDFRSKGVDENTPDQYTTKTEFSDFDAPFQEQITEEFDTYLVDVLGEALDIKTKNPLEYERLRKNWLETQVNLINQFNEEAKRLADERAQKLAQPPVLKFADTQIGANTPTWIIAKMIDRYQSYLEAGEYPNPQKTNEKIQLTPETIAMINEDIASLNGYLNARVSMAEPRNIAEQTIQIIQENIIDKQDEIVEIRDEDGNVIGRNFKDRGPTDPRPDRTTEVAEEVENSIKKKDPFVYTPIKPVVDNEGNVLPSPVENLYNQFFNDPEIVPEDRIRLFMEAFKKEVYRGKTSGWKEFRFDEKLEAVENSLKTVGTYEDLRNTIEKYAFKESSDAGDYIDGLIRIFLTPNAATTSRFSEFNYNSTVELKGRQIKVSDIMSRKAFDKLFGPVTTTSPGGIVTKFRLGIVDGTYTILSENVKLFDRSLRDGRGVTGEVDLLLIKEDGSVAIVDIKTKKVKEVKGQQVSGWRDFGNPDALYESSIYFRAQQSIYGYQFYNSTAITPELKLMPFDMVLSKEKIGYIEDIDLADIVPAGQDTFDLEYLPEIENFGIIKIKPEIKAPVNRSTTTTSADKKADIEKRWNEIYNQELEEWASDYKAENENARSLSIFQLADIFDKTDTAKSIETKKNAELAALETPVSDKKVEGTNARGTIYKGETTEKDGLKVTKYSEFRPDGKRISMGGRIMTPVEFIEEYNITDQDYLDSLDGATEIRIYEVRVGKDGRTGISIQGTFPEGNVEMEVAGAELAALEGTTTPVSNQGIPESDPVMNKLKDNVNKAVIYNGRTGKLIRMPNGGFGVEVVINSSITGLQLTLDALQANLIVEKGEFGNPDLIAEIESQIKKISEAIESTKGLTEVFPLQVDSKNVTNGDITLDKAGIQLIVPIQSVGQLSTVNGEVVNAAFSNKEETIATINGVKYDVLRDGSGNITALSYMLNDEMISQINKQVGEIAAKISGLRNSVTVEANTNRKDSLLARIAKLQEDIRTLEGKKKSLVESNKKMYLYGENANNYIFALNRLPNNFQKLTANATKANETQDLKSISRLSLDSTIADTITEILSDQYPEALDKLIDGDAKDLTSGDLLKIQLWIEDSIERLNQLGYTVINRGDIVDDISNQINALNEVRNNLELIKLTKDGKIFNYKQIGKIFSGEVQKGSSVSKNAGATRKPSEGTSRPATREELEDLVKQAREENLGDVFEQPQETKSNAAAIEKIMNATLSNIDEVYETEFLKAQANDEDITGLTEAYNTRLQQLKTIVSLQNIEVGEYLISKNPIFTDISGEIVIVTKLANDKVTLKNIKTDESREFTEAELVENFEKTTMEATQPEPEVTLTPNDVEDSQESKDTVKAVQNDEAAIAQAQQSAKATDKNSRFTKLGENSKLC